MKHIRIGLVGTGFMGKNRLYSVKNLPLPSLSDHRRLALNASKKRGAPIC
ncbi:MAG: hypothetical protein IKM33_02095 [Clostridia bacterium]|nr:hypothetical protein [Clostridia bacterium]